VNDAGLLTDSFIGQGRIRTSVRLSLKIPSHYERTREDTRGDP